MPFLLCFSYRLYYQYIFIYFSASSSDKAIHHSSDNIVIITVLTISTKPISSSIVNLVLSSNAERIVADAGIQISHSLVQIVTAIAIRTIFTLSRTAAVTELELLDRGNEYTITADDDPASFR